MSPDPAAPPALPASVPVSGADWFMLALDRAKRARVGHGNVCHLVLRLDGRLPPEAVVGAVAATPVAGWIASLRVVRRRPWSLPAWTTVGPAAFPVRTVRRETWDDLLDSGFDATLDAASGPSVALTHVHGPEADAVVLSWHHALLDARGAELLARHLGGAVPASGFAAWTPPVAATDVPLGARILRAKVARDFVFRTSFAPMEVLATRALPGRPRLLHRDVVLAGEALAVSDRAAAAAGAGVLRSAFALACVARAVHAVLVDRGQGRRELLVPVPQDQRPRGQLGPILSNQLGVLFYRLGPSDLATTRAAVASLAEQLRSMVRARLPATFGLLLAMCRRLPLAVYLPIVKLPTWGRIATFGFSDVGDGLARIEAFAGVPVRHARHVPANLDPPGFTVVASRTREQLVVTTAWMEGTLTEAEVARYEATLRAALLGEESP